MAKPAAPIENRALSWPKFASWALVLVCASCLNFASSSLALTSASLGPLSTTVSSGFWFN